MTWSALDEQKTVWSARLVSEVKVSEIASHKLATTIASEVRFLPRHAKEEIIAASPVAVSDRVKELEAFQGWDGNDCKIEAIADRRPR